MVKYLADYPTFVIFLAGLVLSLSLGMETVSWTVRSLADGQSMGHFISRTNIFLYGARIFNLFFVTFVSLLIDTGAETKRVLVTIGIAFLMATLIHIPIALSKRMENNTSKIIGLILGLVMCESVTYNKTEKNHQLKYFTFVSSAVFTAGLSVPYVLATFVPEYRMTMSSISQIINSIGTVSLLFMVDPLMFRMMDRGELNSSVSSYVSGRFLGFGFGACILFIMVLVIDK